jgi:hypothetical protein
VRPPPTRLEYLTGLVLITCGPWFESPHTPKGTRQGASLLLRDTPCNRNQCSEAIGLSWPLSASAESGGEHRGLYIMDCRSRMIPDFADVCA